MTGTRYQLSYPIRRSIDEINDYIYLIYLSSNDEELDTYLHHHRSFNIYTLRAYLQYSKMKIIRKNYIKNKVFKYMISKLVK